MTPERPAYEQLGQTYSEVYLDPLVRVGMSSMAKLPDEALALGTARLGDDLVSGQWEERHGHLRSLPSFDGGYRLAITPDT